MYASYIVWCFCVLYTYVHAVVGRMGNLIGSLGRDSLLTTPPSSPGATSEITRQRRGRKRGGREVREEGGSGDVDEVEELSPRRCYTCVLYN